MFRRSAVRRQAASQTFEHRSQNWTARPLIRLDHEETLHKGLRFGRPF